MRENYCRCSARSKNRGDLSAFSGLDAKIMIEREVLQEQEFLRHEFKKFGFNPDIQIVSIEPTDAEIQQAVNLAKSQT